MPLIEVISINNHKTDVRVYVLPVNLTVPVKPVVKNKNPSLHIYHFLTKLQLQSQDISNFEVEIDLEISTSNSTSNSISSYNVESIRSRKP